MLCVLGPYCTCEKRKLFNIILLAPYKIYGLGVLTKLKTHSEAQSPLHMSRVDPKQMVLTHKTSAHVSIHTVCKLVE